MSPPTPTVLEHMIRELRDDMKEIPRLRVAMEALTTIASEERDALIRFTHAIEAQTETMRELTAAIRSGRPLTGER